MMMDTLYGERTREMEERHAINGLRESPVTRLQWTNLTMTRMTGVGMISAINDSRAS